MKCRQCGTEIAEKALICFRCGAAVTEPAVQPYVANRKRPVLVYAVFVILAAAAIAAGVMLLWHGVGR